ncbi:hypothetical protein EXIGLDRAFT_716064 [Exidia glandulosa HHB12029]|uniref:RING-type domain-containing protein n=1 Tax=Exidia glandulosa HHB12029 TaxID=1314781 RepID=A0A165QTG7_EXIGL|nr:hypothetical protein EXIGLDRAFT_716064 [Exidia glandulosa HHB12029]
MDTDLRCNRLACRQTLVDRAVVTTCSHIFCADCANEHFTEAQICPACETHLPEPDDCVIASLHPTNDYKTSVLSGLNPATILDICGRAVAFWSYQVQQEQSFQQAMLKKASETSSTMQKQLDNVIREANTELTLMNNKLSTAEQELELERRKVRELQDASLSKDKEYAKLKVRNPP